jgi:pimeloyl-ACP methyl ester carboxylesterase
MTAVLVHGVPDTFHLWDGVRSHLSRGDVRALSLPGFGAPIPEGFDATKEAYIDWIIGELEKEAAPVDLVGHDWGCLFTARIASLRPDLVRTWAAGDAPVSADYVWHPLAQIWQTPGDGEAWMVGVQPGPFAEDLAGNGVPLEIATENVSRVDETMKDSILRLYRSAVTAGSEWEPDLVRVTSPGLVFWGIDDRPCPVGFADKLAESTGAQLLRLESGHWTPLEKPAELAAAIESLWASATR